MVRDLEIIFRTLGKSFVDSTSMIGWISLTFVGVSYLVDYVKFQPFFELLRLVMVFVFVVTFILMFPLNLKISKYEIDEENR